jgi:hypothetical protein
MDLSQLKMTLNVIRGQKMIPIEWYDKPDVLSEEIIDDMNANLGGNDKINHLDYIILGRVYLPLDNIYGDTVPHFLYVIGDTPEHYVKYLNALKNDEIISDDECVDNLNDVPCDNENDNDDEHDDENKVSDDIKDENKDKNENDDENKDKEIIVIDDIEFLSEDDDSMPIDMTKLNIIDDYLQLDPNNDNFNHTFHELHLSVDINHKLFWVTVNCDEIHESLTHIVDLYSRYINPNKSNFAAIGNFNSLDEEIDDIQNTLMEEPTVELLFWGSKWKEFPFRNRYLRQNVCYSEHIVYQSRAMEQADDGLRTLTFRTLYSGSIISLVTYGNNLTVKVKYPSSKYGNIHKINHILGTCFPLDIPIDVVQTLAPWPYMSCVKLFDTNPITRDTLWLAYLLSTENNTLNELQCQINEIDTKNIPQDIVTYISKLKSNINFDSKLLEILDGVPFSEYVKDIVDETGKDAYKVVWDDIVTQLNENPIPIIQKKLRMLINNTLNKLSKISLDNESNKSNMSKRVNNIPTHQQANKTNHTNLQTMTDQKS